MTFLRFVAALIVVIFHFGKGTDLATWGGEFIISGQPMVTFFFVLSGFVMTVSHFSRTRERLRDYYLSRIARIVPVYLLALLLVVLWSPVDLIGLTLSILFAQAWVPSFPLRLNTPGWSLSVEMFFYLSLPLLVHLIRKHDIKTVQLATFSLLVYITTQVVLSALMTAAASRSNPALLYDLIFYFPPFHYCSFLLGVSGGVFFMRNPDVFNSTGPIQLLVFSIAVVSSYFLLQYPDFLQDLFGHPLAYDTSFYGLIFLALILGTASSRNPVTRLLARPPLPFLGEISYSLYILQQPVYTLYSTYISNRMALGVNGEFFLYLTILIAVSAATYLFVEKPSKVGILKIGTRFQAR